MKNYCAKAVAIALAIFTTAGFPACSSDDDDDPVIYSPEGTVSKFLDAGEGIDFFNYSSKLFISSNNGSLYFSSLNSGLDIVDCGNMKGLAEITAIPKTGWVRVDSDPPAIEGHGYVVRYTNTRFKVQLYASLYLIKRVHVEEGHSAIKGYEILYLSPFNPTNN